MHVIGMRFERLHLLSRTRGTGCFLLVIHGISIIAILWSLSIFRKIVGNPAHGLPQFCLVSVSLHIFIHYILRIASHGVALFRSISPFTWYPSSRSQACLIENAFVLIY